MVTLRKSVPKAILMSSVDQEKAPGKEQCLERSVVETDHEVLERQSDNADAERCDGHGGRNGTPAEVVAHVK